MWFTFILSPVSLIEVYLTRLSAVASIPFFSLPVPPPSHLFFSNPIHLKNSYHRVIPTIISGLLTGKYSRGEKPAPGTSRLGWVEENKQARSNQSHPSLSEYADKEKYWQLVDAMKKIANKRGKIASELVFKASSANIFCQEM